jgi:hypothetical protein
MSTVTGGQGNIVTNGLVLNLDAANPRSYPQPYNGTVWQNIAPVSSSLSGSLINGPTYNASNGGSIVFDGSNDFVQIPAINVGLNFTVCIWARPNLTSRQLLFSNSYRYFTNEGFLFNIGNNGTDIFLSIGQDQEVAVSTTGYVSANTWFYGCATFNGTTARLFVNGLETLYVSQAGSISTILYNTNPAYLGRWLLNGTTTYDLFSGRIGITQLYNRALSSQEVLQNFNATRARFGI